jgi:hypothetical protein
MMVVSESFNSLQYFELLRAAGVSEQQARIQVDMLHEVTSNHFNHLVTKADLVQLETKLDSKIVHLETKLDSKIVHLEDKLDVKMLQLESRLESKIVGLDSKINFAKWQTIGSMFGLLVLMPWLQMFFKHLGW